jgi:DNA polymerase-3 subunit beta
MLILKADRDDCLAAVQAVLGAVERRHTLPILANLLLRKTGALIEWTSSDLEMQLRTQSQLGGDVGDFATSVGARKLADILRALPTGQTVSITAAQNKLTVQGGRSRFTLQTLPAADFPQVQEASDYGPAFSLDSSVLKTLIEQVEFAMAANDIRYYLNGVLMQVEGGLLTLVASDGNRLALAEAAVDLDLPRQAVILPRKTVQELLRLLREQGGEVQAEGKPKPIEVRLAAAQVHFKLGAISFVSRLVEGKFPNHQSVVPQGHPITLNLSRAALLASLQRVAILTNERFRGIRLTLTSGLLRVSSSNAEHEEAVEDLEVDYSGARVEVGFNVSYLTDVLADTHFDTLQMALRDGQSSVLITCAQRPGFKYVVSPMRI